MRLRRTANLLLFTAIVLSFLTVTLAPTAKAAQRTFVIEMKNIQFFPNLIQVDPGDVVTIVVFNNDTTGHTFDITEFNVHIGTRATPLQPGENGSQTFTADRQGTFWFFCDIPGHASRSGSGYTGMAGRFIVGQPAPLDLTLVFIGVGIAVAAAVIGAIAWLRRRRPRP